MTNSERLIADVKSWKETVTDLVLTCVGCFLLAASSAYFVLPFDILTGGVAGIAVVVSSLIPIPAEWVTNGLTIVLFIVGWVVLGKGFAYRTVLSTIFYPLFLSAMTCFPVPLEIDPLLASIYAGVLMGAGVGLVFRTGASTGGMDIPPLIIHKYTGIELSKLVLLVDTLTVAFGLAVFGVEKALVGLISVYVSSIMIDKMMLIGGQVSKSVMVISDQYEAIMEDIHVRMGRGTTLLKGKGGYTRQERPVVLAVISKKEYPELSRIILHRDPQAFIIVSNATEVKGEGFSYDVVTK